jgi:hypothetical protein
MRPRQHGYTSSIGAGDAAEGGADWKEGARAASSLSLTLRLSATLHT